jgi:hypothetical protein
VGPDLGYGAVEDGTTARFAFAVTESYSPVRARACACAASAMMRLAAATSASTRPELAFGWRVGRLNHQASPCQIRSSAQSTPLQRRGHPQMTIAPRAP